MNIFILDEDPQVAASHHCDRHVLKMVIESAQILCTTKRLCGEDAPYKTAFKNHPCTKWARRSLDNYVWLCELALGLCREYTHRYGKVHKTQDVIEFCSENPPKLPQIGRTEFVCVMPEHCKVSGDPVENYREYYRVEKSRFAEWKNGVPDWF